MKTFLIVGSIIVALIASGLGGVSASASGQIGDSPGTAPYLDNAVHTLAPYSGVWFRFDYYAGDRAVTTLTLVDGNKNGIGFEVWTPDTVADMLENKPVGRGTASSVPCDIGTCPSNDLTWVGAFGTGGTYFVKLFNNNNVPVSLLLTISGAGVNLGAPPAQQPPAAAPLMPPPGMTQPQINPQTGSQNLDDPNKSMPIDNGSHSIAAHSALWFNFNYSPATAMGDRIARTVKLINGKDSGVRFEVWTPDHVNDWWDHQKPVGQGTVYMVDCDTGLPSDTGQCQSPDLIWTGSFNIGGTYYVRVVNDNSMPTFFSLTIN